MPKGLRSSGDDFTVKVLLLKYLVDIRAVAMHLLGEPFDRSALLFENRFDDMSYMEIRHPSCIKLYRELLLETEVLEYLITKARKPTIYTRGRFTFLLVILKFSRFPFPKEKRKRLFYYYDVCYCFIQSW